MKTTPNVWEILDKVIQRRMLVRQEIHELWRKKEFLERYADTMLVHTSSIVYCAKRKNDQNAKAFRDAEVVRVLKMMDEAIEKLTEDERQIWLWRYQQKMTLAEIGQMLTGLNTRSKNPTVYWKVRASKCLNRIAFELARILRKL